jgi:uncharacterized protein YndB with AHSA1/START domain
MSDTTATGLDPLDRIDKSIDIAASAETVWDLVSRPGWWINQGTVDADPELRREGDVTVVHHPEYGDFRLRTVESDRPSYVAFRWIHRETEEREERTTLVEFRIEERPGGGVTLSVAESGFSQLSPDRAVWLADREGNVKGWDAELDAARIFLEGS